jgi:N-acetylglucosaminyl-diphospho-decaprenol L-rhamnosyltransferase
MIKPDMLDSVSNASLRGNDDVQVAVVCLTHGAGDSVIGLLDHLQPESIALTHQVIVVHNQSAPNETLSVSPFEDVQVVELTTNRAYVGGMNAGIDLALRSNPEFVLLLTHDVRITADDVQKLYTLMCAYGDLAAIGPILCDSAQKPYSAGFVKSNRVRMEHRLPSDEMQGPIWPCAGIDGSAMMWRVSALQEVGRFDDRFFMYFEDVDICARATRHGWGIAVAADVQAVSVPGNSNRRMAHAYLKARNGLAYSRTFGPTGIFAGLAECVLNMLYAMPRPGQFHDQNARALAARYWRGTLFGVLDYFRGRWGAPPAHILRDSDMKGSEA